MDASPSLKAASREPSLPRPALGSGIKRPAPSLLPPFEPLSSSPGLPRPVKRQNTGSAHLRYPTPIPTSSTGILSSSPVRRPALVRGSSERAPLSALPNVELNENGDALLMGRSSNSSHFQLSANRLVSRIHVKARYIPAASPLEPNKIEISCHGWNGIKLHCQGRTWELYKGDSFTSETEGTEIMMDVQDARVMIQWPKRAQSTDESTRLSDSSWEDSPPRSLRRNSMLQSSPLRRSTRIESPISPTPGANLASAQQLRSLIADDDDRGIEIYEDDEQDLLNPKQEFDPDATISMRTEATASFSSEIDDDGASENDPDEENDPVIHSFGPFGANISSRLASITTKSPRELFPSKKLNKAISTESLKKKTKVLKDISEESDNKSRQPKVKKQMVKEEEDEEEKPVIKEEVCEETKVEDVPCNLEKYQAISNHVVNQLAFSRGSSMPLSTIMQNLPAEQTKGLTRDILRVIIESTGCIGIIPRQGKDAAGKALESDYYYDPEKDNDEQRRAAVVDGLRKPSLRACRKQHKQYYWKRPKTP